MGHEIERKFLVDHEAWTPPESGTRYRQGYLCYDQAATVRVRIAGEDAYLTIKSRPSGIVRSEFEYPIPIDDAQQMLELAAGPVVDKTRYLVEYEGKTWEVDIFHGANEGLVMAEVELDDAREKVMIPPWIDREVSGIPRYCNSELSRNPYSNWRGK